MSSAIEAADKLECSPGHKVSTTEVVLLCCSVLSLIASCILWSPHKQIWMDEIFTWKEVSDRSLWHLYYAVQHGADGGQPLFYTTAWLWAKAFGTGVLTLRLYSSVAVCAALVVVWRTVRRFYGVWATGFGVMFFWSTSNLLLDQNVEARFYGLYLLTVAITVYLYTRLVARAEPSRLLLFVAIVSQAALVLTHVLGLIYSALILFALILFDVSKGRLRVKLYLVYSSGWLALSLWIPAILASMAAGKPHGWMSMPSLTDVRTGYLFVDSLQWLRLSRRLSSEIGFQLVSRAAEFVIYVPIAGVFLFSLRRIFRSGWRTISDPKHALILLAYTLLSAPLVLFVLSHLVTPVFSPRYFLPSGIGLAIILTASADALGADAQLRTPRSWRRVWIPIVLFLMVLPVLTAAAVGPVSLSWAYLDVPGVDHLVPATVPIVTPWEEDFVTFMRLSPNPARYFFLLDWPAALAGPRASVLDYHLMQSYRANGYFAENIQDRNSFLCSHTDFMVLDSPNANTLDASNHNSPDFRLPNWFDVNIRTAPQFEWKVIAPFDGAETTRKLIAVHRFGPLSFCRQPAL